VLFFKSLTSEAIGVGGSTCSWNRLRRVRIKVLNIFLIVIPWSVMVSISGGDIWAPRLL